MGEERIALSTRTGSAAFDLWVAHPREGASVGLLARATLYSYEIIDVCASDHYFAHAQAATRALFVRPLAFT